MASLTLTKEIAAPVEIVFALFTDLDHAAEHISGVSRIDRVNAGPVGLGTRWRETRLLLKQEVTEEMEITGFVPNQSYTVGCLSKGTYYESVFRFRREGNGTRVTLDLEAHPQTLTAKLLAPLGWLLLGIVRKCTEQDMDDLRAIAEATVRTV